MKLKDYTLPELIALHNFCDLEYDLRVGAHLVAGYSSTSRQAIVANREITFFKNLLDASHEQIVKKLYEEFENKL